MRPEEARLLRALVIVLELFLALEEASKAAIAEVPHQLFLAERSIQVQCVSLLFYLVNLFLPLHLHLRVPLHRLRHALGGLSATEAGRK